MDKRRLNNLMERIIDSVFEALTEELGNIGDESARRAIRKAKVDIVKSYNKIKSSPDKDGLTKLEMLEREIEKSAESIDIGMKQKETHIKFAMQKLGYSKEQIQQVIDVANEVYEGKSKSELGSKNMSKYFVVSNITPTDVETKKIRITVDNKKHFPGADNIEFKTYVIKIKIGSEIFEAKYRVGKGKSGVLSIGTEGYKNKLGIKYGDKLKITVLEENKLYLFEKIS